DREGAGSAKPMSGRVIDLRGDESKPVGQRWRRVRMVDLVRDWTDHHLGVALDFDRSPLSARLGSRFDEFIAAVVSHLLKKAEAIETTYTSRHGTVGQSIV